VTAVASTVVAFGSGVTVQGTVTGAGQVRFSGCTVKGGISFAGLTGAICTSSSPVC
jgi:hypothetical protein